MGGVPGRWAVGQLPYRLGRHVDLRHGLRPTPGPHANYAGFGVQFGMANVRVIANLITGGVCHRFPGTKFVSVESGIGWIPFAMEHLDWQWLNCGVTIEHPEYDLLPSEYFKRQMYGCFWFERGTVKSSIDQLGRRAASSTRATSPTRPAWRPDRQRRRSSRASTSPLSSATSPTTSCARSCMTTRRSSTTSIGCRGAASGPTQVVTGARRLSRF